MDKRMRMNRIKNIKELQALQREIDLDATSKRRS